MAQGIEMRPPNEYEKLYLISVGLNALPSKNEDFLRQNIGFCNDIIALQRSKIVQTPTGIKQRLNNFKLEEDIKRFESCIKKFQA